MNSSSKATMSIAVACAMVLGFVGRAGAEGDAERGRVLSETCLGCHGIPSYTNVYPTYRVPKIGGQNAGYIIAALNAYKGRERAHGTMHSQAHTLTPDEMEDIAAYFAAQGGATQTDKIGTTPSAAATCVACHGDNGLSVMPDYPNLAGQYADYLEHALLAYQSGDRANAVMTPMAAPLSEREIEELAEYYSEQKGLATPER